MISKTFFGKTSHGEKTYLYTITNEIGMAVKVTNYGASLCSLSVPDKNNVSRDVVLGYDDVSGYDNRTGSFIGATVGRNANRIANATFAMDDETYYLEKNSGKHNLHSGSDSFAYRVWKEKEITDNSVVFSLHSPNLDQGFPNAIDVEVAYILKDSCLKIVYGAEAEEKVFLNMTNHSYFNLNGHEAGDILNHQLWIDSNAYVETNEELIPTGKILNVENTPMDFRQTKRIGDSIQEDYQALVNARGYDHCFVLKNDKKMAKAAILHSEESGITMEVCTDMPGVHIYTGNFLENEKGKKGVIYKKNHGTCFETGYFPNAINEASFDIAIVEKGEKFSSTTAFKFNFVHALS